MVMLRQAHENLFTRPPDEHFASFDELWATASAQRLRSAEHDAKDTAILFSESGTDVHFGDVTLRLTPYSMSQMAVLARVPAGVLQRLTPETRARVLNQTFPREGRYKCALMDEGRLRAITSDRYRRVWDSELLDEVDRWLLGSGFVPAVPTINTDEHGTNALGNTKPALFRSDRDLFTFFYGDRSPGDDGLGGMRKGVMVFNSEVGASSFGFAVFWFRQMCSNFLIWDALGIKSRRARHMGSVKDVVREFREELVQLSATVTTAELDAFHQAAATRFVPAGGDEDGQAVKRLNREFKLSEADAREVVMLARAPENPGELSVWGIANGITSAAKAYANADDRVRVSSLAGRVMGASLR